jgi:hypothetical protein
VLWGEAIGIPNIVEDQEVGNDDGFVCYFLVFAVRARGEESYTAYKAT